ncbi:hypothetical protein BESB_067960 [Besnoitia besnoiti]|uniref:Uncharacterized protein n=1 Tax=Besnoitia besnoiti TaxID=94643 RepID=A0A2A9MGI5_BESBE|nr:hypothetical protein BESB_067960 [Besnoitia besnoiti]PFH34763.1 hypothetical protein BESB_067960 [Besnoitia besnoiti]
MEELGAAQSAMRFPSASAVATAALASSRRFALVPFSTSALSPFVSQSSLSALSHARAPPASCAAAQQPHANAPDAGVATQSLPASPLLSASSGTESSAGPPPQAFFSSRLCAELAVDTCAASIASFGVSPFVTIIDRSIVRNAAGVQSLWASIAAGFRDIVFRPRLFFSGRDFRIVCGVYAGTYLAANGAVTVARHLNQTDVSTEFTKFLSATAANMYLCIRKDIIFAQLFNRQPTAQSVSAPATPASLPSSSAVNRGASVSSAGGSLAGSAATVAKASSRRFPLVSTLLFVFRDSLTIAASFNAPAYVASWLSRQATPRGATGSPQAGASGAMQARAGADETQQLTAEERHAAARADGAFATLPEAHRDWTGADQDDPVAAGGGESIGAAIDGQRVWRHFAHRLAEDRAFADSTAQVLCPVGIQLFSTPLHLLALDIFNNPGRSPGQRSRFLVTAYGGTVLARASRILPAFGIGGILNTRLKDGLRKFIPASEAKAELRAGCRE